ncbi:MAG TPA: hypothetical protein DIC51_05120 [Coxiellaceae bacterium]|nr:hypothetical protein [Coxiellaceae bacterium]
MGQGISTGNGKYLYTLAEVLQSIRTNSIGSIGVGKIIFQPEIFGVQESINSPKVMKDSGSITALAVLHDGSFAVGSDRGIHVWNVQTGTCLFAFKDCQDVTALFVLRNGLLVAGFQNGLIRILDPHKKTCLFTLSGHSNAVRSFAIFPDDRLVSGSLDQSIKVWDICTRRCLSTLIGHSNPIYALAILPDGCLISGSYKEIKIWNTVGECIFTLPAHDHNVLTFVVLSGNCFASGSQDKTIKIWDARTRECLRTLTEESSVLNLVAFHNFLISGSYGAINIFDPSTGICCFTLEKHSHRNLVLAVFPDACLVLGAQEEIKVWNPHLIERPLNSAELNQLFGALTSNVSVRDINLTGVNLSGSEDALAQLLFSRRDIRVTPTIQSLSAVNSKFEGLLLQRDQLRRADQEKIEELLRELQAAKLAIEQTQKEKTQMAVQLAQTAQAVNQAQGAKAQLAAQLSQAEQTVTQIQKEKEVLVGQLAQSVQALAQGQKEKIPWVKQCAEAEQATKLCRSENAQLTMRLAQAEEEKSRFLMLQRLQQEDELVSEMPLPLLIPSDQLHIERQLGKGGYGCVKLAKRQFCSNSMFVAIKQISREGHHHSHQDIQYFQRCLFIEAALLAWLHHPNIITVLGLCYWDISKDYGLVMEYLEQGSLATLLDKKSETLSWLVRMEMALGITKAIAYLHRQKVVHGDLTASNVLVKKSSQVQGEQHYEVKVSDFGLARRITRFHQVRDSRPAGTLTYRAPEVYDDPMAEYTEKCDVFSLAVILWEIASRKQPWGGQEQSAAVVKLGQREQIPDGTPSSYAAIIRRGWTQEPKNRPTSAIMEEDLTRAIEEYSASMPTVGACPR